MGNIRTGRLWVWLALFAWATGPAAARPMDPTGNWLRDNGRVRMMVSRCGEDFCAVNTWVKRPEGPEKVGDRIILKMHPVSDSRYQGLAYDVRRGLTYRMTVTLQGNRMETSGCVLFGVICKGIGWRRLN